MTKILLLVSLLGLALIDIGCAHSAYVPNTPHQIPVVSGRQWGGKVGFDFSTAADVPIFSDLGANPPTRAKGYEVGSMMGAGSSLVLGLGIFESVDLYYTTGFGGRWQFYGKDPAEPWKATLFLGTMGGRSNGSTTGTEGSSDYRKAETKLRGVEYGTSVGYQQDANILWYGTVAYRDGRGETSIVNSYGTFSSSDKFSLLSLVAGVNFGTTWYFNAEVGTSAVDWENATSGPAFASSIGFGYNW